MQRIVGGTCAVMALLLSGCQALESENVAPFALATLALEKHYVAPDCQVDKCSEVTISALNFPRAPELTDALQDRLLALAMGMTEEASQPAESWDSYAQDFLTQAQENSQQMPASMASEARLSAEVYAQHNNLLVVELNTYVYQAGQAHGLPMTEFMVIDERQQQVVDADDMLIEGQEAAFQALLNNAHQRWLEEQGHDEQFATHWPLSDSRNIAPLPTGWQVTYNVYEIAPYAEGQPTLTIAPDDLEGIAKPRYLGR